MVKVTQCNCDIKGCSNEAFKEDVVLPVTFTTEQTEGRSARKPYIEMTKLDICEEHYNDFVFRNPLTAIGAQGYNDYSLDVTLNRESWEK